MGNTASGDGVPEQDPQGFVPVPPAPSPESPRRDRLADDAELARQQRFIEEYVKDERPTLAARRAGYDKADAGRTAHKLLARRAVRRQIDAVLAERRAQYAASIANVLDHLSAVAFSNILDFIEWDEFGTVRVKPSAQLDRWAAAAVKKIKRTARGEIEIELHDKPGANERIGKHLGMFRDEQAAPAIMAANVHIYVPDNQRGPRVVDAEARPVRPAALNGHGAGDVTLPDNGRGPAPDAYDDDEAAMGF